MSYSRGSVYAWGDTRSMHIWTYERSILETGEYDPMFRAGVRIPMETWNRIVRRYVAAHPEVVGSEHADA